MSNSPDKDGSIERAKELMASLLRQPPKHHDEMKVGKRPPAKSKERPATKGRVHKGKTRD